MAQFFLEISNFLSDAECEHVKDLARKNGLRESVAGFEEQAYKGEIDDALRQAGTLTRLRKWQIEIYKQP